MDYIRNCQFQIKHFLHDFSHIPSFIVYFKRDWTNKLGGFKIFWLKTWLEVLIMLVSLPSEQTSGQIACARAHELLA